MGVWRRIWMEQPLSSVQDPTVAAVQEAPQPSLELLKNVRLRWRHLL